MHELSLCNSIYGVVERAAAGRPVDVIHLEVGQLRQVVPDTLVYCWGLVSAESPLAGSQLAIDHIPVRLDCRSCQAVTNPTHALVLTCGSCGGGDVAVGAGEEFMITSLDLKESPHG